MADSDGHPYSLSESCVEYTGQLTNLLKIKAKKACVFIGVDIAFR